MSMEKIGVLVGVDGSACADEALDWAAADAAARGIGLVVMAVTDLPRVADVPLSPDVLSAAMDEDRRITDARADRARRLAPGTTVETRVASGNPAGELLRMAATAQEVVVGSRGHGGFAALMLGSTAGQLAAHAQCPTVVVRGRAAPGGRVVVGVDGSDRGDGALGYAFAHADRHGLPLHAISAYAPPVVPFPASLQPVPPYSITMDARVKDSVSRATAEAVQRWAAKFPAVRATWDAQQGQPAQLLVTAAEGASLLVLGSRGHGGLAGMLLGSVSQAAVRHAPCPVAVVH